MPLPVNPGSLLSELRSLLTDIDAQIEQIKEEFQDAKNRGQYFEETTIYQIKNRDGRPILNDMLAAKAQTLSAIAVLQAQPRR